ncbi:MAG: cysteine--tRNA ligase [Christensenellales bacterium]|jgi:cysteinyl-tRNA synthetase
MQIFNTMSRRKEEFVPVQEGKVGIYACGPTVYNYFHIGNARPFIIFDTLRRYLEFRGYEVTFVQNFTDIDDKMINKAAEEGIEVCQLADQYIQAYYEDADALGIRRADMNPRATEHIGEIVSLIDKLLKKGHAYESDGDVYYSVESFPDYGKLSGQPLENLEAGARIEPGVGKRHPMDFALWKAQKPGEPAWDSPWGSGRPGWHIECSAMASHYLGETFDIHGGGQDLIFPHHENEIAQSEGACGKTFAKYWMHNGYINVDNRKMSKSVGNFFTVRDIAKEFDLEVVRFFMLSGHYRSPINFSRELLQQAESALERLQNARDNMEFMIRNGEEGEAPESAHYRESLRDYEREFIAAMDDDLNTADAIGVLFELVRHANTYLTQTPKKREAAESLVMLERLSGVLGLLTKKEQEIPQEILALAEKRQQARKEKDFARADALRDEIGEKGYILEDTPQGPKLKKA